MTRPSRNHVIIIDGTLSSMAPERQTNAGRLYALLREGGPSAAQSAFHHPGVQGAGWSKWIAAATGEGLNEAILEAYGVLAGRWRPGDRIFLFGYSRGAYAVRSLAGLIDNVGLLRPEHAIARRVQRAFRCYEGDPTRPSARKFARSFCWPNAEIEMIGVWDTVKALGPPYPFLSRLAPFAVDFHDDRLGPHIKAGFHALAIDEDRAAFAPVLWRRAPGWSGVLEQVWFPGAHGDVGGERGGAPGCGPLRNLPFTWMLKRAEARGLILPEGWRRRFPCDPAARMVGSRSGLGRFFLLRQPRAQGTGDGESLHESVALRAQRVPGYRPRAVTPSDPKSLDSRLNPA